MVSRFRRLTEVDRGLQKPLATLTINKKQSGELLVHFGYLNRDDAFIGVQIAETEQITPTS